MIRGDPGKAPVTSLTLANLARASLGINARIRVHFDEIPFHQGVSTSLSLFLSALRNAIHVTICVRVWKLMSRTRKSFVGPLTSTWLVINFFWLWKGWKRVRFAKEEILFYFVIGLIEILVMIMIFCHKECSMLNIFHWLCDFYCLQLFWKNYWYRWIIYRIRKW